MTPRKAAKSIAGVLKSRLAQNSLIYIVSEFSLKLIPIILIPILTQRLTKADYGLLINFQTLSYFLNVSVALGTFTTFWSNISRDPSKLKDRISELLVVPCLLGACLLLATLFFRSTGFLGIPFPWLVTAVVLSVFEYCIIIVSFVWLFQKKAKANALLKISRTVIEILVLFTLISVFGCTWETRLWSVTISATLVFGFCVYFLLSRRLAGLPGSWRAVKKLVRESLPSIPYELSTSVKQLAERFLITYFLGAAMMGGYGLGNQLGIPIHLLGVALLNAFIPLFYERMANGSPESMALLRKPVMIYVGAISLSLLVLIAAMPYIFDFFIDPKFHDALVIAFIIATGYAVRSVHGLYIQYIIFHKKTRLLGIISIVNLVLYLVFVCTGIHFFGITGAAVSFVASELFMLFLVLAANRYFGYSKSGLNPITQ